MKMFVWDEDVLLDYTSGMAVAVAETVEEARAILVAQADGYAQGPLASSIVGEPNHVLDLPASAYCWGGS